jgi:hypothetical protein
MSVTLTTTQATADAITVLRDAGYPGAYFVQDGGVTVESHESAYPGIQRADHTPKAIRTVVRKAAPQTDLSAAAAALRSLPGVLQISADAGTVIVIRNKDHCGHPGCVFTTPHTHGGIAP